LLLFRDDLAAEHSGLRLEEVNSLREQLTRASIPAVRAVDVSDSAKIPFKLQGVLHSGIRRNLEMADAFVAVFNTKLFTPLFVLARATLETGALLWHLSMRVRRVVDATDTAGLGELDDLLMRATLGSRDPNGMGDPDKYPAPNVLTALDRTSQLGGLPAREFYDMLSEYAHPNYEGLTLAYTSPDPVAREVRLIDVPFEERSDLLVIAVGGLVAGLALTKLALDCCDECRVEFVTLCEVDLRAGMTCVTPSPNK